jgi:ABC-type nickel/cobalt efflux system permease component RcnA|tara:strand:- start:9790 stop:9969 length:180 start_codon:yes stop_codon:yes gene_type:complete
MDGHIIDVIGTALLLVFGLTMIYQGHMIYHSKRGYRHAEKQKQDAINTRRRIEELLRDK